MTTPARKFVRLMIVGLSAAASLAAQTAEFKRNSDYICNGEKVTVTYCRNDSGPPVQPVDNVCRIEYPDRPRRIETIPPFEFITHGDFAKKIATSCKLPPSSDASVAKAQAAKVDTVVFGIQLGDPFDVPACPMFQVSVAGQRTCYSSMIEQVSAIAEGLGADMGLQSVKVVYLGVNECPSWVNECTLAVTLYAGKVGAVNVFTKGPSVDKVVQSVLAEKYGQWKYIQTATVTPGDSTKAKIPIVMRYWELPGLYVQYQPIWSHEDGDTPNIREGIVRVETETARKTRTAAPAKPKVKM